MMFRIVQADRSICDYMLAFLVPTEDCGEVKSIIRSDRDLQRVPRLFKTPKIYVTIEPKNRGTYVAFYGHQSVSQLGIHAVKQDSLYNGPFAHSAQIPVGYLFPTGHGTGPDSTPHIHGERPESAPAVDQIVPNTTPTRDQPCVNAIVQVKDHSEKTDGCSLSGNGCFCNYNHESLCSDCYRSVHTSSTSQTSASTRCYCNYNHESLCSDCFRSVHKCDASSGDSANNEVTQPAPKTQSKAGRCGICRAVGHTRRTCPFW